MWSNNLLKFGFIDMREQEARIIDTNAAVEKRLRDLGFQEEPGMTYAEPDADGFSAGFMAESIDGLLMEGLEGEGGIIKAAPEYQGPTPEELLMQANAELENAMAQVEQAKAEAEAIVKKARNEAASIKEQAKAEGQKAGYQEGSAKAQEELRREAQRLQAKEAELERIYQARIAEVEPELVDTITGIYEQIFHLELSSHRDILVYLISNTLKKAEGDRNFIIHVSKDDYAYVSMQKKQIIGSIPAADFTAEVIEDMLLAKNECLIETDSGVFECGVSTQLEELRNRLMLLAYEK